jgi:hypothetical protein
MLSLADGSDVGARCAIHPRSAAWSGCGRRSVGSHCPGPAISTIGSRPMARSGASSRTLRWGCRRWPGRIRSASSAWPSRARPSHRHCRDLLSDLLADPLRDPLAPPPLGVRVTHSEDLGGLPLDPVIRAAVRAAADALAAAGWLVEEATPPLDGVDDCFETIRAWMFAADPGGRLGVDPHRVKATVQQEIADGEQLTGRI